MLHHDYRAKRDAELQANLEVARAVAASFDAFLDGLARQESAVGKALSLLAPSAPAQANAFLARIERDYPEIVSASWLDPDGTVAASSEPHLVGRRWPDLSWLPLIARGREQVVTDVVRTQQARDARFSVVHATREAAGKLRGVVVAVVDPNRLDRVITIRRSGAAAVSLVDSTGWLAFRLPPIPQSYEERDWGRTYQVVRRALAGDEATDITYVPYQRGQRIVANVPIASVGWAAGAGRPEPEVLAPLRAATAWSAITFFLVAVLGVLLATVGARAITRPIERLRRSARTISEGRLDAIASESGPAELAELGAAFNQMARGIQQRGQDLRESEARYRGLFESMQEGFALHEIICDDSGKPVDYRFLEVNPGFERQTGLRREDVLGRTVLEVLPGVEPEWIETFGRVALTGEPARIERRSADLGRRYEAYAFSPRRGQFAVIFTDVTQRELQRERVLAAERERAELAERMSSEISHYTRNSLAVVAGLLEMGAAAAPDPATERELLREAVNRIRLFGLVHGQVSASRGDEVELVEAVSRIAQLSANGPGESGLRIAVSGDPVSYPLQTVADLCIAAHEMLANATRHATCAGGHAPTVETLIGRKQGAITISVWHTGEEPTDVPPGSTLRGLGLVQGLAQHYRGTLTVGLRDGGTLIELVVPESELRRDESAPADP